MIHSRLQLDPGAQLSLRPGSNENVVEILILDPRSECSAVIELSRQQLAGLCEEASVQ